MRNTYLPIQHLDRPAQITPSGLCEFFYAKREDVAIWPPLNPETSTYTEALILKEGATWYRCEVIDENNDYSEESKTSDGGPYVEMKLEGFLPDDTLLNTVSVASMRYHEYVILLKERNGIWRLLGHEDAGAKFAYSYESADLDGARGRKLVFTMKSQLPAAIYLSSVNASGEVIDPPWPGGGGPEDDPTVPLWVKNITEVQVSNWNTAFMWGNHAAAGYLTKTLADSYYSPISHNHALSSLTDVEITGISEGHLLRFDSVSSKWKNWNPNYAAADHTHLFSDLLDVPNTVAGYGISDFDTRARGAISEGPGISYNATTGIISNIGVLDFNGFTGSIVHAPGINFNASFNGNVVVQNITTNASGHLVNVSGRNLTPADIGAATVSDVTGLTRTLQQVTNAGNASTNALWITGATNAYGAGSGVSVYFTAGQGVVEAYNSASTSLLPININGSTFKTNANRSLFNGITDDGASALQVNGDIFNKGNIINDGGAGKGRLTNSIDDATRNFLYSTSTGFGAYRPLVLASGGLLVSNRGGSVPTDDGITQVQVAGDVKAIGGNFNSTNGTVSTLLTHTSAEGVIGTFSNHPLQFRTNSTPRAVMNQSGEWGFGMNPITNVRASFDGVIRSNNDIISNNGTFATMLSYSPANNGGYVGTISNHPLGLYTNATLRATITAGGALLINKTTGDGTSFLEVNGTAKSTNGSFISTNGTVFNYLTHDAGIGGAGTFSNHALAIYTNSAERARFTTNGYLGIGTTNPLQNLVVSSGGTVGVEIAIDNVPTQRSYVQAFNRSTNNYTPLALEGALLTINEATGGYVGIGTSTPSSRLDVAGTVTATTYTSPIGYDAHYNSGGGGFIYFNPGGTTEAVMNGNGLRIGSGTPPASGRSSVIQADGNVWCTDAYILGLSSTPVGEFGLTGGNVFLRTMASQDILFQTGNNNIKGVLKGTGNTAALWGFGAGFTAPTSTVHIAGSVAVNTRIISSASATVLNDTDTIVHVTGFSTGGATGVNMTLPDPASFNGRLLIIIEETASSWNSPYTIYRTTASPLTAISGTMFLTAVSGKWFKIN